MGACLGGVGSGGRGVFLDSSCIAGVLTALSTG